MISIARDHSRNLKHRPALRKALDEHLAAQTVGAARQDENVIAA